MCNSITRKTIKLIHLFVRYTTTCLLMRGADLAEVKGRVVSAYVYVNDLRNVVFAVVYSTPYDIWYIKGIDYRCPRSSCYE